MKFAKKRKIEYWRVKDIEQLYLCMKAYAEKFPFDIILSKGKQHGI